jgi:NAD(P)H dehydrogenase (quinone)
MTHTILVTGAAGKLGRGVVRHLLDAEKVSPARVIATTREPDKLADFKALGVTVRRADFNEPGSLERAFAGAQKILIISTDLLDLVGGKRLAQHEAAVRAAKRAGASHVAYTSMIDPEPGSPIVFASDHYGTEQAIRASGLAHTIFRTNAYMENLLTMSLPGVFATGRWQTSAGDGRIAYAARDDMAAAIAGHLTSASVDSATLELTGPVSYTNADVARLVTDVTGKRIEIVHISDTELAELFKARGVPEPFARLLASVDIQTRAGTSDVESDILERLSRRAPISLRQFLEANRATLLA